MERGTLAPPLPSHRRVARPLFPESGTVPPRGRSQCGQKCRHRDNIVIYVTGSTQRWALYSSGYPEGKESLCSQQVGETSKSGKASQRKRLLRWVFMDAQESAR